MKIWHKYLILLHPRNFLTKYKLRQNTVKYRKTCLTKSPKHGIITIKKGGRTVPAYKYKTEEEHALHLQWRRDYYRRNREKIRARDNESARRKRAEDPERFKQYQATFRAKKREEKPLVNFDDNPDRELILEAIRKETSAG